MRLSSDSVSTYGRDRFEHPFFIIGSGRSGSTLLARMLNAHPRLAVPGESHLFDGFYHLVKYYGDLEKRINQERFVDDILSTFFVRRWNPPIQRETFLSKIEAPTFAGIMDAMMRTWAEEHGKARWGEKTPHHIFYWREILECFPDARLIHLVRDGRDVAGSYIRSKFGAKTIYMAARRWADWLQHIEELRQVVDPNQFLEVRYEDILTEPEFELTRICEYLGESFSNEMLEFHMTEFAGKVPNASDRRNLSNPLLVENAQKWRKRYSKEQLRVFESAAQPMLLRHNYETVFESRPTLAFHEHFYHRAIEHPVRKWPATITHRLNYLNRWARLKIVLRLKLIDRFRRQ